MPEQRAVSPIVGVVLLLVITVLLVGTVAGLLYATTGLLGRSAPAFAQSESVQVSSGQGPDHALAFRHDGGQVVDASNLRIRVTVGGNTTVHTPASTGALSDGTWSAGEQFHVPLNGSQVCTRGATAAHVTVVYRGSANRQFVLSQRTVPIERTDFVIHPDSKSVVPTRNYTAKVRFIGSGWGTSSRHAPVRVLVRSGGSVVHEWHSNDTKHDGFPPYHLSTHHAGTSLSVTAEGKTGFRPWSPWRTVDASHHAKYMRVLRDGDPVPNAQASSGQKSVAAFVAPYVKNGNVSLRPNQAIFLFDFNTHTPTSQVDYQDAVVLVSFYATHTQTGTAGRVYTDRQNRHVITCQTGAANGNGRGNGTGNPNNGSTGNPNNGNGANNGAGSGATIGGG